MKNHIVVDFGDNYTSIFYWYYVDSLLKLKECINKRFKIHLDHQTIKYGDINLDEESYAKLYKHRFVEYPHTDLKNLKVDILDTSIIQNERQRISKKGPVGKVLIPWLLECPKGQEYQFKAKDNKRNVIILKHDIKPYAMTDVNCIVLLLNDFLVLSDEQLLADLFLDFENETLILNMVEINHSSCERPGLRVLPSVTIIKPWIRNEPYTDIEYPLLEVGQITLSAMKSWIEANYEIPCQEQLLRCEQETIEEDRFPKANTIPYPTIKIELYVYSTNDRKLNSTYQFNNIRTLTPINITSFETYPDWQYNYRGITGETINEFIENKLQIPQHKQFLFTRERKVSQNDIVKLLTANSKHFFNLHLVVQADDEEKGLLRTLEQNRIRRIRSIIVKHPHTDSVLYDIPFPKFKNNSTLLELIIDHCNKLSEDSIGFFHKGTKLRDYFLMEEVFETMLEWNYREEQNFVVTLFIKPNTNQNMKQFCQQNEIKFLNNITVNFLTGQFSIDLSSILVKKIEDLKRVIYKIKRTPPHLQVLFYQNKEQHDDTVLRSLGNSKYSESITFNLVVKPGKEVELFINCVFLEGLHMDLKISETDTVGDLKEIVSSRSGVPATLMVAGGHLGQPDDFQIWESGFQYVFPVDFNKKVLLLIKRKDKDIERKSHQIRYYEHETIRTLCQNIQQEYKDEGKVIMKKKGFDENTLLKDVGDKEITFIVQNGNNSNCLLM